MLSAASLFMLSACTVGPDFVRPDAPPSGHYNHEGDPSTTSSGGEKAQRFAHGVGPVENWWKLFNSERLNASVTEALAQNYSLQAAQASLRQSNDILLAGSGIFYPQISADLGATRQKFSPARLGSTSPASIFNLVTVSASVSYALDVFGGERRAIENLQSQVDLQRAIVLGTYLALSGNVVNSCIAVAAYRQEIQYVEELIALQKKQVAIGEAQFKAGTVSYEVVIGLHNELASLEAMLPPLRQRADQAQHLLATLAGRPPSDFDAPQVSMYELSLPDEIPLSLPSELVRRRPDILAAEAQLHGASASIGVATAALFPSFTLNGTYGQNGSSLNNLFSSNNRFWSIGTDVFAPLFNGGTLRSRRQAAIDAYQQSLALYRQTVLDAFAQVADAIRALEHDAELAQAESEAEASSHDNLALVLASYQSGTVSYQQVVVADIQYHQARIGLLQARAQRMQDTTALFVALGGDWTEVPPK